MINYANMRYVAIYRTSTSVQSEKSIPDQKKIVQAFAASKGMIHAGGDLEQSGVSATKRRSRTDIDSLTERKKTTNDFDVIIVHDYSRLTRKGARDAFSIEGQLNDSGIHLLSATEPTVEGPHAAMIKAMLHSQHEEYARSHAQRITRGQSSALLKGTNIGSGNVPFGIDRLYVSSGGRKNHIIRVLPDGSQVRLHPDTGEILSYYEKGEPGTSKFYRRQPDEHVVLIPGDQKHLDLVRRIFQMIIIEGRGYASVAHILHDEGLRTLHGHLWGSSVVKTIVTNPIYTGRLIRNLRTKASYYKVSKDGPIQVDSSGIGSVPKLSYKIRPQSEWIKLPSPATEGILDPKLREKAIAFQDRIYDTKVKNEYAEIKKDKHVDTSFILKNILRCKEGNLPMRGFSTSRYAPENRKSYRYYTPRGYLKHYEKGAMKNRRIPAEPLEALVLNVLSKVFSVAPDLQSVVRQHVEVIQSRQHEAKTQQHELESQRRSLVKKISCLADIAGEFDDELVKKVLDMKHKLRELEARIKVASAEVRLGDPEIISKAVVSSLLDMKKCLSGGSVTMLRRVLTTLVSSMECDTLKREVWVRFSVPSWAMEKMGNLALDKACLDYNVLKNAASETNNLLLAEVHMWCLPQEPMSKKLMRLESYRYAITGGVLKCDGEYIPTGIEPPQPPPVVMKAAPFDLDALEDAGWGSFTPWTFWTPLAT